MQPWTVISLGGSIIVPEQIDISFLKEFISLIKRLLNDGNRFAIITGGGRTSRRYQEAAKEIREVSDEDLDWLGIHATRLNAHLIRTLFEEAAMPRIVTNPEEDPLPENVQLIVGAGWKPGHSTDYDAAVIAERLGAKRIVNLSNISHVYSADPKQNPEAKPIKEMNWEELLALIGCEWKPGLHTPFDPIAAKKCQEAGIEVAILSGENLENIALALRGEAFEGTFVRG